jgi:hypothetical protein
MQNSATLKCVSDVLCTRQLETLSHTHTEAILKFTTKRFLDIISYSISIIIIVVIVIIIAPLFLLSLSCDDDDDNDDQKHKFKIIDFRRFQVKNKFFSSRSAFCLCFQMFFVPPSRRAPLISVSRSFRLN